MSRDGEKGRECCPPAPHRTAPLTLYLFPPFFLSIPCSSHLLSPSLPFHLINSHHHLPRPPPLRSMPPLALSFQRVPRSTGACSSEQGFVGLSVGTGELISVGVCVCVHDSPHVYMCLSTSRGLQECASVYKKKKKKIVVVFLMAVKEDVGVRVAVINNSKPQNCTFLQPPISHNLSALRHHSHSLLCRTHIHKT